MFVEVILKATLFNYSLTSSKSCIHTFTNEILEDWSKTKQSRRPLAHPITREELRWIAPPKVSLSILLMQCSSLNMCVCVLALTYALRMSLIDSYRKNRAEDSFCQGGRSGSNDVGRNHLIIEGTRYP